MSSTYDQLSRFCEVFLDIALEKKTGTLKIVTDRQSGGREVSVLFHEGGVVDLDLGEGDSVLVQGILATGAISDRDVKKVRKKASKRGSPPLGILLFELGRVAEEELLERVQETLISNACELFSEDVEQLEFTEHGVDEVMEGFNNELSEVFDIVFAGEDIFLEAMRKLGRWDLVQENYPSLLDIYYATPSGMRYYNDPETYESEIAIIKRMDGRLDLDEVIEAVPMSPFDALQVIQILAYQQDIQPLSPIQMFQLGVEASDRGEFSKGARIFQRAIDLGLDDFDIQFRLGQAYEASGDTAAARERYLDFAEKCVGQSRRRDAIRALQRVAEITPLDIDVQRSLAELLIEDGRQEEAIVQGLTAAESLAAAGSQREALGHLLFIRDCGLQERQLSSKIIALAEQCGERGVVEEEIARNSTNLEELLDADRALEMYQKQFCEGNTSIEIRLKLIELHLQKGHNHEVLAHINGVLSGPNARLIQDTKVLAWLHKTRCSIEPGNVVSNRWLIDYYVRSGKEATAIELLDKLIGHMEAENEVYYLRDLRRHMIELDPDNLEYRWKLVTLLHGQEKYSDAVVEIEKIAELAIKKKDSETLERVWNELLRLASFHREALFRLIETIEAVGAKKEAVAKLKSILWVDLGSGNITGAREVVNKIESLSPNDPDVGYRFGRALLATEDSQNGVQHLVDAAKGFLKRKDIGSAKRAVEAALAVDGENAGGVKVKKKIEELEEVLTNPGARRAPASAPAAAQKPRVQQPQAQPTSSGGEKEAFQPRAPIRKTTVSAITARLRNLQGDSSKPASGGKKVVQASLKSITENLKKQRKAGETAESKPKKGDDAGGDAGAEAPAPKPATAPVTKKKGVGGVASRLKALAAGDASTPPPSEKPAEGESAGDATGDAPAQTGASALGGALVNEQMKKLKAAGGAKKKKKNLGGPAAKLAQLRAKKEAVSND